jgi:hypothetical protein
MTLQQDVGVSRHAVLDDILQGLLQDAIETQGYGPWQRSRDVLAVNVNRHAMPAGQLPAEASRRGCQPQELQFRGVEVVRQRLNIGDEICNLLADVRDLLLEARRRGQGSASGR